MARSIHHKPVKAGIVSDIDHYRWSSHDGYLNKHTRPEWLKTDLIVSHFARSRRGLLAYQQFMHAQVEQELQEYYGHPYGKPLLGSNEFVRW